MVIWLVGLSGAGKTTIGKHLFDIWKPLAPNTVLLDGDEVRDIFGNPGSQSHSIEDRRANAQRMTKLCAWLDRQDINVICCILSIFPEMRRENRALFSDYFEAYIEAPMEVLLQRDTKGLYAAALAGKIQNVVGVDIEFPVPVSPDLVINTAVPQSDARKHAADILAAVKKR